MASQIPAQPGPVEPVTGHGILLGTLRGHTDHIGRIVWSPDGSLLVTPSRDGTARIWDGATRDLVHTITGHEDGLRTAAFDRHGRVLATGSDDHTIKFWRVGTWELLRTVPFGRSRSLAFNPRLDILAAAGLESAALIDVRSGGILHQLFDSDGYVYDVAFDPVGAVVATASRNSLVELWDVADGRRIMSLVGHDGPVITVAFAPGGRHLVSGGNDRTIKVWDRRGGGLVRTLEGHNGTVRSLSFLADGRLLASKGVDSFVGLWDCETWDPIGSIPEPGRGQWFPGVACHPSEPLLAAVGSDPDKDDDAVVHLWDINPDRMFGQARPSSVTYTSAKVVLVGESGVGKTGLGYRLTQGAFKDHPSTHGQQFWVMDELGTTRTDGAQCEAILWDLAGQPDYRLVHALFLDDADLALILFDPTSADDPLRGVDYWLRQLRSTGGDGPEVILVAARADRGDARLTTDEITRFCAERGIRSYLVTSALAGEGLPDLVAAMRGSVNWGVRPATVTTETFKWIKDTVLRLKESDSGAGLIVSPAELRDRLERDDTARAFSDAEMHSAVGHLVNHGYVAVLRTSRGEKRILLAPELLNNVAASIVLEARRNPKGLGSLEEQRVLSGGHPFPELSGLAQNERDVLLDSAVAMFLQHNVCFRETDPLNSRVYLVFPELINLRKPAVQSSQPVEEGVAYTVTGAVENVYASLVVLLGYTDVFTRTNQWRNQAEYVIGDGLVCGLRLEEERDGELDFVLSFGANVGGSVRMLFQSLFESFLAGRDLTVRRFEPVTCGNEHPLNRAVVREQLGRGNETVFCTLCGERMSLPRADVPIQLTRSQAADVDAQRWAAAQRSRFEQALFRLKTYVPDPPGQPTCFISYAWGDPEHERWVEHELARDLAKAGITVILDRWENARIGSSVPRFVERAAAADRIVVVGTPQYRVKYDNHRPMGGFVAAAEGDVIGKRMIGTEERKLSVLPVLLDGTEESALPALLHGRVYADFRRPAEYFLSAFDLILSVHDISPQDPIAVELRPFVDDGL